MEAFTAPQPHTGIFGAEPFPGPAAQQRLAPAAAWRRGEARSGLTPEASAVALAASIAALGGGRRAVQRKRALRRAALRETAARLAAELGGGGRPGRRTRRGAEGGSMPVSRPDAFPAGKGENEAQGKRPSPGRKEVGKSVMVSMRRTPAARPKRRGPDIEDYESDAEDEEEITLPEFADNQRKRRRNRCDALCIADELDLERISAAWEEAADFGVVTPAKARRVSADVLSLQLDDGRLCFVFAFGSLVCWGLDGTELQRVRRLVRRCSLEPFDPEDAIIAGRVDARVGAERGAEVFCWGQA